MRMLQYPSLGINYTNILWPLLQSLIFLKVGPFAAPDLLRFRYLSLTITSASVMKDEQGRPFIVVREYVPIFEPFQHKLDGFTQGKWLIRFYNTVKERRRDSTARMR